MKIILAKFLAVASLFSSHLHFTPPRVSPLNTCQATIANTINGRAQSYSDAFSDGGAFHTGRVFFSQVESRDDGGLMMEWSDVDDGGGVTWDAIGSLDAATCSLSIVTTVPFTADRSIAFHSDGGFDGAGTSVVSGSLIDFTTGSF